MNVVRPKSSSIRKPVNISMSAALLAEAKALNLNLSKIAESAVESEVRSQKFEDWRKANAPALKAYRERVRKRGVLLDGLRRF